MLEGHKGQVLSLAYAPDGATLASGDTYQRVRAWDPVAGEPKGEARLKQPGSRVQGVFGMAIGPDNRTVAAAGGNSEVAFWDLDTGKVRPGPAGHVMLVRTVAYGPGGVLASIGRTNRNWGGCDLIVWGPDGDRPRDRLRLWNDVAVSASWSEGGLLAVGLGKLALVWTPSPVIGPVLQALDRRFNRRNLREPAGVELDLVMSEPAGPLRAFTHGEEVAAVALSPDGRRLAVADGWVVRLWELPSGRCLGTLGGHAEPVQAVAFAPRGGALASGSQDGTIRFWSADDGVPLGCLDAADGWINALAFAPDGMTLAAAVEEDIYIWDVGEALAG